MEDTKDHWISKGLFGDSQFSQEMNEKNSTLGTMVVKSNIFVRFLGELKIPKRHFEIDWPLQPDSLCISNLESMLV